MKIDLTLEELRLLKWLVGGHRQELITQWNKARFSDDHAEVERIKKGLFPPLRDLGEKIELARRAAHSTRPDRSARPPEDKP